MRVGLVCFVNSNAKQTLKTTLSNFTKLYPSVCVELHRALSNLDLAAGDGDGCSRGEAGDDWLGDEVDEEAEPEEAAQEDDQPGDEGEQDGVVRPQLGVLPGHEGHDGGGADSDVLRGAKHDVDETSHEGGVQPVLRRQSGNQSIGDT